MPFEIGMLNTEYKTNSCEKYTEKKIEQGIRDHEK